MNFARQSHLGEVLSQAHFCARLERFPARSGMATTGPDIEYVVLPVAVAMCLHVFSIQKDTGVIGY